MSIRLENIERLNAALVVVVCALAALTGWLSPRSVLLGGAVMGANFWLMRQLLQRLLGRPQNVRGGVVLGIVLLKFALFTALLVLLFFRVPIDPLGFGAGATLLLAACVIEALRNAPVSQPQS